MKFWHTIFLFCQYIHISFILSRLHKLCVHCKQPGYKSTATLLTFVHNKTNSHAATLDFEKWLVVPPSVIIPGWSQSNHQSHQWTRNIISMMRPSNLSGVFGLDLTMESTQFPVEDLWKHFVETLGPESSVFYESSEKTKLLSSI